MNCDQAFDVMTSSRREIDRGLRNHLDGCPRCREMRETLDPALHLFHRGADELSVEECSDHDKSWSHTKEANEIAAMAARQLAHASATPPQRGAGLWSYAAAMVLGAGLVWCTIIRHPSATTIPSMQRSETICRFMADTRPKGVSAFEMTQSCLACHSTAESK